jgi:hypothetical protein
MRESKNKKVFGRRVSHHEDFKEYRHQQIKGLVLATHPTEES